MFCPVLPSGPSAAPAPRSPARVWVVDDSALEAQRALELLSGTYAVEVFADAAMALERLAQGEALPCLVLLDWHMPGGLSGLDACRFLRERYDEVTLPILVLTASTQREDLEEALAAGANDFVPKPYNDAELLARVRTLVRVRAQVESLREREQALRLREAETQQALSDARAARTLAEGALEEVQSATEALRESEERFRQIANALPMFVWTATPDFFVDWYNDWWFEYLGLPRGTRWDDPATLPMHPEDVARTRLRVEEALATGQDFLMEQRFRRGSDGEYRWHLVRGAPIRGPDGRIVKWVGANADIHDQKTVTARLEEERELRERFVATLSHDLRTPLTAAKLNAQMLARKGSDPLVLYRLAARITENLDRADVMIRDMLDANRIRAGELLPIEVSECELEALARETLEELSLVHGDRFVLSATEPIHGHWSSSGIRRIIENLCNNAVKYGAREHPVTVSLAQRGPDEVEVSVHNWGTPLAPGELKQLFKEYRRADSAQAGPHKGWGLGLTIVEGLARAHRGTVRVESAAETGTTFTVTVARDARR
ncbi:MAG TPA: ATP-binding protein [Aggregicoccus sp.]|nr:ATP-binding protein [Aggregicoccus sp.]